MKHDRRAGRDQRKRRGERGQAVVELALLLPLFLLLVFGMIEFGKALNYWIDTTHLANEGSRYAAVNRWPGCVGDNGSCNPATLQEYVWSKANTRELREGVVGGNVEPAGSVSAVPGAITAPGVYVCYPDSVETIGSPVRVVVNSTYRLNVVDGLLGAIGLDEVGEIDMSASSTMRMERRPLRITGEVAC